jgi:hypothetical protein
MSTLSSSGALWHLHAWKNPYTLAARFEGQRLKQVRRAIRRQRWLILKLRSRRWFRRGPAITENGSSVR